MCCFNVVLWITVFVCLDEEVYEEDDLYIDMTPGQTFLSKSCLQ